MPDKGITVKGDIDTITVDLHIVVCYGVNINAIADSIVHNVKYTVEEATGIKVKNVDNSAYTQAYKTMSEEFEQTGLQKLYQEGRNKYKRYQYSEAEKYFKQCLKLKADYPEVMYWLGLCYYNTNDKDNAQKYFYKLQQDYPDTQWSKLAKRYMPYTEESEGSEESQPSQDEEQNPEEE
mgnify:CR=1 FL=1